MVTPREFYMEFLKVYRGRWYVQGYSSTRRFLISFVDWKFSDLRLRLMFHMENPYL